MTTRTRIRSSRRVRQKRGGQLQWFTVSTAPFSIAQNNVVRTNVLPVNFLSAADRKDAVVMRIVGSWWAKATTPDLNGQVTAAYYPQRLELFTASIDPELELDFWGYMWYDSVSVFTDSVSGGTFFSNQWLERPFDIKTKRKFRSDDDTIVFLRENTSVNAVTFEVSLTSRVLIWTP